ncbi:MAG: transporter substrate-binding domain-containing protein [Leptospiraceae bacterium]|nr:transporter substrate-binding domain-containing protein [Leptospiraceae bacterium]MCP5513389.1 transporter substrate-binding domain-containing protein [Leptospiraceae bacterium]
MLKICLLFFLFFLSLQIGSETLNICYDHFPPSTIIPDTFNKRKGYAIDMIEEIYRNKGFTIKLNTFPYARGLLMIQKGECDIYAEAAYSPEEENNFIFGEEPTFLYQLAFVVRKDSQWRFQGIESLKEIRVATGVGWDYSYVSSDYQKYLTDPENKGKVEFLSGEDVVERILKLMISGRIDAYCDSIDVINYFANKLNISEEIREAGGFQTLLVEKPIFSPRLTSKKRKLLMDIWNSERKRYSKTGRDLEIKRSYERLIPQMNPKNLSHIH